MALTLPRHRLFALLSASVAILVLGAGFVAKMRRRAALEPALLAVPAESYLAATLDLDGLRASTLSPPLVALTKGLFADTAELSKECGFDPFTRAHTLAVTVPEAGSSGEFGLVITGEIHRDELVLCAEKLIAARGGKVEKRTSRSFTILTDGAAATAPTAALPQLALREGGPLLVGRGPWLETMMQTAEGDHPNISSNGGHEAIRAKLKESEAARTIIATALLPKLLRDRLKLEMAGTIEGADPLSGKTVMAGVLGVESAGLALTAGASGQQTSLLVQLKCETPAGCAEVANVLEKKKTAFTGDVRLRLAGLGPVLDALQIAVDKDELSIRTHAPSDKVAEVVQRLLGLLTSRPTTAPAGLASNPPSPPGSTTGAIAPKSAPGTTLAPAAPPSK